MDQNLQKPKPFEDLCQDDRICPKASALRQFASTGRPKTASSIAKRYNSKFETELTNEHIEDLMRNSPYFKRAKTGWLLLKPSADRVQRFVRRNMKWFIKKEKEDIGAINDAKRWLEIMENRAIQNSDKIRLGFNGITGEEDFQVILSTLGGDYLTGLVAGYRYFRAYYSELYPNIDTFRKIKKMSKLIQEHNKKPEPT